MSTDPEILAAWLQHAYHVNDSHFVAERWRAVADEAIRRLTEAAHRPAEPARPLLAQFGAWCIHRLRGDNLGTDIDGGEAQDEMERLGLLSRKTVTEPCCEEGCVCAEYGFPVDCLRLTDAAKNATEPAPLSDPADLISHLRCVLFTNGIEGAKHMAVIDDFRSVLAAPAPRPGGTRASSSAAVSAWRFVRDEKGFTVTVEEPAPLSDEQIDAIKFGRYITRATAFNADCRAFARAIERAVIAAHQQPK